MKKLNLFNDYHMLEDRITHGFIATLNSLRPKIARELLGKLFNSTDKNIDVSVSDLVFDVQSPSSVHQQEFSKAKQGVLLKITQPDTDLKNDKGTAQEDSRADGWIFDGETVFLVESKLVSSLSGSQLQKHRDKLSELCESEIEDLSLTWQDVYKTFNQLNSTPDLEDSEKNVLEQFLELMYVEGVILNFENLYNSNLDEELRVNWESNHPKRTLKSLKNKVSSKLKENVSEDLKFEDEQTKETRAHYFWKRLFTLDDHTATDGADWRSTLYINPDKVLVDLMIFDPGQSDFELFDSLFPKWLAEFEDSDEFNLKRMYLYLTNYGKRRSDAQQGRDYRYAESEFNLGKHGNVYESKNEFPINNLQELIQPKQIGFKYRIFNPGGSYWDEDDDQETINHKDAELLRNPDDIVEKFSNFLKTSFNVIDQGKAD